jgi:hypothetical protein
MPSFGLPSARAEASRRNGAKSRGPKTPEGKARSAQNALKHGFRAQKYVVLPDEDAAAFQALEAALMEELAPEGALQTALARRVVAATWRLERAERLEAELFAEEKLPGKSLALALIRDCNGARAFDPAALPRRHARRVLARAAHPQGASGRSPDRARRGRGAASARRAARDADRTQKRRKCWRFARADGSYACHGRSARRPRPGLARPAAASWGTCGLRCGQGKRLSPGRDGAPASPLAASLARWQVRDGSLLLNEPAKPLVAALGSPSP